MIFIQRHLPKFIRHKPLDTQFCPTHLTAASVGAWEETQPRARRGTVSIPSHPST